MKVSDSIISLLVSKSINEKVETLQVNIEEHDRLNSLVEEKLKSLDENKEDEGFPRIEAELRLLSHKEKLGLHVDKIEKYIEELKWIEKAKKVNWGNRTVFNNLTRCCIC